MQQQYLNALAEPFKAAHIYSDKAMTGQLAKLLELSMQPAQQLRYWQEIRGYMFTVADTLTIQSVDEYLEERVKQ